MTGKTCGAPTGDGGTCRNPVAAQGNRCHLHGGSTSKVSGPRDKQAATAKAPGPAAVNTDPLNRVTPQDRFRDAYSRFVHAENVMYEAARDHVATVFAEDMRDAATDADRTLPGYPTRLTFSFDYDANGPWALLWSVTLRSDDGTEHLADDDLVEQVRDLWQDCDGWLEWQRLTWKRYNQRELIKDGITIDVPDLDHAHPL